MFTCVCWCVYVKYVRAPHVALLCSSGDYDVLLTQLQLLQFVSAAYHLSRRNNNIIMKLFTNEQQPMNAEQV